MISSEACSGKRENGRDRECKKVRGIMASEAGKSTSTRLATSTVDNYRTGTAKNVARRESLRGEASASSRWR